MPIYDELHFWEQRNTIQNILTRHKQGAVQTTYSHARVTDQIVVCFARSGLEAINLIINIANNQLDCIPILVITGQVNLNFLEIDGFQETGIFEIPLPIVKHSYKLINPNDICEMISEALYIARNGRPSLVLIDIPKDIDLDTLLNYEIQSQNLISQ